MSAEDTLTAPLSATARTTLHRHKERGRTDRADLYAVLDAGLICHLGVVIDGLPVVLPTGLRPRAATSSTCTGRRPTGALWPPTGSRSASR